MHHRGSATTTTMRAQMPSRGARTHTCAVMVWGGPPAALPMGEDHPLLPMPPGHAIGPRCAMTSGAKWEESSCHGRGQSPHSHHMGGDYLEWVKITPSSPRTAPGTETPTL